MASKHTSYRTLWDRGVPLNAAWLDFAPEPDQAKFHASLGPMGLALVAIIALATNSPNASENARSEMHSQEKNQLESELKARLRDQLIEGRLIAIEFPPVVSGRPKPIRSEIFSNAEFDFSNSVVRSPAKIFENVRILARDNIPESIWPRLKSDLQPNPIGRPSKGDMIQTALDEIAPDQILMSPNKLLATEIRNAISRRHGIDAAASKGLSDKTIENYISRARKVINPH